jgi:hypothetical protein
MPVREFTDGKGREWRAWDVEPDELNPRTQDETYLAQLYFTGWIVFETTSGDEKRRLYPIPKGWHELADPELEVLLQKAEVVPPRKLKSEKQAKGAAAAEAVERAASLAEQLVDDPSKVRDSVREETPDITDLNVVRTFRYPGGRIWAACVLQRADGGSAPVLRFSAGSRDIDLVDWPKDWADYSDSDLVKLLRRAAPRRAGGEPPAGTPRRRWDDRPQA